MKIFQRNILFVFTEDLYGTFAMLQALIDLAYIELSSNDDNLNLLPKESTDSLEMVRKKNILEISSNI